MATTPQPERPKRKYQVMDLEGAPLTVPSINVVPPSTRPVRPMRKPTPDVASSGHLSSSAPRSPAARRRHSFSAASPAQCSSPAAVTTESAATAVSDAPAASEDPKPMVLESVRIERSPKGGQEFYCAQCLIPFEDYGAAYGHLAAGKAHRKKLTRCPECALYLRLTEIMSSMWRRPPTPVFQDVMGVS